MIIETERSGRNQQIDFTKGFLVITMVAYHTLNYYLSGYHKLYGYVGYVTQAFIFYSGFMCGTIYYQKFLTNKKAVYGRLVIRGLKLVLLFFIANVIIHLLLQKNYNTQDLGIGLLFNNLYSIFVTGDDRISAFAILLPIGYTLLIASPLINFHRLKYILYAIILAIILIVSIFNISLYFNLVCIITGIGGVLTGLIYNKIGAELDRPLITYTGILLLLLFLFFVIPFGFDPRKYLVVYFFYINLVIFNLHLLGGFLNPSGLLTKVIIKFGQYSLFLYLAQIFFLQVLKRVFDFRLSSVTIDHLLIFIFVNILLMGLCYLTDYLRSKNNTVDRIYRLIFA